MSTVVWVSTDPYTGMPDLDQDAAVILAGIGGDEVIALAGGNKSQHAALERAQALGAARCVRLDGEVSVGRVVTAVRKFPDVRLLVMGVSAAGVDPRRVAQALDWPCLENVQEVLNIGEVYLRARAIIRGNAHMLRAKLPVVIVARPDAAEVPLVVNAPAVSVDVWPDDTNTVPDPPAQRVQINAKDASTAAQKIVEILEAHGLLSHYAHDVRVMVERVRPLSGTTLHDAHAIIAGGKGLANYPNIPSDVADPFEWAVREGFDTLLRPLAESLGGMVAATRAVIDGAGIDTALQVGQSGRRVCPELYLAVGVSGAVQHMQGVRARLVIAINDDPEAPILEQAHVGVVGDVYAVLPALLDVLAQRVT